MKTANVSTDFSPHVRWLFARTCVALVVIACAASEPRLWTAAGLVVCVWLDAIAGWQAKKAGWAKTSFANGCEFAADFICFIWAPLAWLTAGGATQLTWLATGIFVLAGAYRLVRFQVEGLVRGGYRGLPVTYMGYAVPLAGLFAEKIWPHPEWVWPVVLLGLAWAMVTTRFVTPEF